MFRREETNFRLPFRDMLQWLVLIRRSRDGNEGIVYGDGRRWKEQRRFTIATLRDFGFGKSSMEDLINEEVVCFCQHLAELREGAENRVLTVKVIFSPCFFSRPQFDRCSHFRTCSTYQY